MFSWMNTEDLINCTHRVFTPSGGVCTPRVLSSLVGIGYAESLTSLDRILNTEFAPQVWLVVR